MNKIFTTILSLGVSLLAFAGGGFQYQAALRTSSGEILKEQNVTLNVSILQEAADGEAVYSESHSVVTDAMGSIDAMIGCGETSKGNFDEIEWAKGPYFMKVEAMAGENDSRIVSVQELLSVPAATEADQALTLQQTSSDGYTYQLIVDELGNLETIKLPKGYTRLVFNDEFNGTGLPDPDKWNVTTAARINDELEYYTTERVENTYQQDGVLHIRCINNDPIYDANGKLLNDFEDVKTGKHYNITSGRLNTRTKGDWTYCYVEARIKVPIMSGTWPAVWMLSSNNEYGYWPNSGEIDIMEHIGNEPLIYHCALHHRNGSKGGQKQLLDAEDWHVIGFSWTADKMEWSVDGRVYSRQTNPNTNWGDWPYNKDFYLILNLAFGGNWGGQGGIKPELLPAEFLVDYVRVFKP